MLPAGEGEVAHHVEAVPAAGRPAGHHGDDNLSHEANEPLHLEDVEATGSGRIDRIGTLALRVPISVAAADALVAPGAEGPTAVLRRGAVSGQQDRADISGHAGVVERAVELVDSLRPEGVADLGPVEGDADRPPIGTSAATVVGDVRQVEALHGFPAVGVEDLGHSGCRHRGPPAVASEPRPRWIPPGVAGLGSPRRVESPV